MHALVLWLILLYWSFRTKHINHSVMFLALYCVYQWHCFSLQGFFGLTLLSKNVAFMNAYCLLITDHCSESEKACIRLAAAKSVLQLSRRWDLHFSPEIFRFTISMAKVCWFDCALEIGHWLMEQLKRKEITKHPLCSVNFYF